MRGHGTSRSPILDAESRQLEEGLLAHLQAAPAGFACLASSRAACYAVTDERLAGLDARFERLALDLFAYQYERIPVYRAWCEAQGRRPATTARAIDVPALPVEALRDTRIATFPSHHVCLTFETSGTTAARPGVLHLDSLALYDTSLERAFVHHVLPDRESMRMLFLIPEVHEAPHSSLSYMMRRVRERFGGARSATCMQRGRLDWQVAQRTLIECARGAEPVCLLGTTFAYVQLLDACAENDWSIELARGSRVFETGGYKGRTRQLSRRALYAGLERRLGIPPDHMVSEYGMTELGSQYYTLALRRSVLATDTPPADRADRDIWSAPHWLRAGIVHSGAGRCEPLPVASAPGLLTHHDLANRSSVAHLLCADIGRPVGVTFALAGRAPRADLRGCGLVAERDAGIVADRKRTS